MSSIQINHQYDPVTGEIQSSIRGRADRPAPEHPHQFRHDSFDVKTGMIYDQVKKEVYHPIINESGEHVLLEGKVQKDLNKPVIAIPK